MAPICASPNAIISESRSASTSTIPTLSGTSQRSGRSASSSRIWVRRCWPISTTCQRTAPTTGSSSSSRQGAASTAGAGHATSAASRARRRHKVAMPKRQLRGACSSTRLFASGRRSGVLGAEQGGNMRVKSVICSVGRSGYMHRDLMAIKSGARQDGFLFHGKALSPGFKRIVEPASIVSVMLELEDGQIAFGDCADVILAGVAGRDPAFRGEDHLDYLLSEVGPQLKGRAIGKFRDNAEEFDRYRRGGKPLHTAVRYGLTQALLHASALAQHRTMAEIIAGEYGTRSEERRVG